ncbi:MAG: hypothetical protein ABIN97_06790 [Ginsengibacter sp.]
MTILEAKTFARNKTLKATGLLLAILIFLLLLGETRGDFANGILFFMQAVANIHALIILTILFGLTYFLSGLAGKEVILENQNILLVSVKYAISISLAISIYAILIGFLRERDFTYGGFERVIASYFLGLFFKTAISLLVVWIWATNKMKSVKA